MCGVEPEPGICLQPPTRKEQRNQARGLRIAHAQKLQGVTRQDSF